MCLAVRFPDFLAGLADLQDLAAPAHHQRRLFRERPAHLARRRRPADQVHPVHPVLHRVLAYLEYPAHPERPAHRLCPEVLVDPRRRSLALPTLAWQRAVHLSADR